MGAQEGVQNHRKLHNSSKVPRDKLLWGLGALTAWILIFAAGLLVDAVEYRHVLAPRSVPLDPPGLNSATSQSFKGIRLTFELPPPAPTAQGPLHSWYSFLMALVCFTPLNLFFLALTSGLAGGCASNIAIDSMHDGRRAEFVVQHPRRSRSLQEPPVSAAFRGFIVYLCVIAGLYIVLDNPFKDSTPGQYIRLAGTLSIMAFLVGYDSSRIEDWLRAIPGPGKSHEGELGSPPPSLGPNYESSPRLKAPRESHDGEHPLPETQEEAAARVAGIDPSPKK